MGDLHKSVKKNFEELNQSRIEGRMKAAGPFLTLLPIAMTSSQVQKAFLAEFLLPYAKSPIKPEPNRSMVAGSGAGVTTDRVLI